MGESRKVASEIAKAVNRRFVKEKLHPSKLHDLFDEEIRKRNLPGDQILSVRLDAANIAAKLRRDILRELA